MGYKRHKGKKAASPRAQDTVPQDEIEKDMTCLPSKSPGHETSRTDGPTETLRVDDPTTACTKTKPITMDSATDASNEDVDEPNTAEVSAFEERVNHLVAHLTNEEDREKLKIFMMAHPGLTSDGSTEYYNCMAPVYALMPDQMAKGRWLKEVVKKHADFIGLCKGADVKALDYAAGTGWLSHIPWALAPYASTILAIDNAIDMVDAYNTIAEQTKADHPACEMKAAWGDLSRIRKPAYLMEGASVTLDDCQDIDLLAMCLAVDFFGCGEGLMRGLGQPLWYLKQSGTILIIDIEKCDGPGLDDDLLDGEKSTGNSSQEVIEALRGWVMEDIQVIHERFQTEVIKGTTFSRNELYFIIRAKKGERSQELLSEYE